MKKIIIEGFKENNLNTTNLVGGSGQPFKADLNTIKLDGGVMRDVDITGSQPKASTAPKLI